MPCSAVQVCTQGYPQYLDAFDTFHNSLTPIGIARDGRKIYGPHNGQGKLWQPCDVDYCNGLYIFDEYVYVATYFFPYITACYGPANSGNLVPSCSSNPRKCSSGEVTGRMLAALASVIVCVGMMVFA